MPSSGRSFFIAAHAAIILVFTGSKTTGFVTNSRFVSTTHVPSNGGGISLRRSPRMADGQCRSKPRMTLSPLSESETSWVPVTESEENISEDSTSTVTSEQGRRLAFEIENPLSNPTVGIGRTLVLIAAAVYGTNFASVKMLDAAMPLSVSASLRFSLAAAVFAMFVFTQEVMVGKDQDQDVDQFLDEIEKRDATVAGMEVGAWYSAGYVTQALGLLTTGAAKCSFFGALSVVVVPLLDCVLEGKTLDRRGALSVGLALAGVSLLELGPLGSTKLAFGTGDLLCLSQAFFFGVGYRRLEEVSSRFPKQSGRCTAGQLLAVAAGSILYCIASGGVPTLTELGGWLTDAFIVKSLLWTGLIATAMAIYLETVALKVLTASEVTVLLTSVSLWGSAFAYVTMGEVLSPLGMVGGIMILSGCVASASQSNESDEQTSIPLLIDSASEEIIEG